MPFITNDPVVDPFISNDPEVSPEELQTREAVQARIAAQKSRLDPMAYARGAVQGVSDFAGQVQGTGKELGARMSKTAVPETPGEAASLGVSALGGPISLVSNVAGRALGLDTPKVVGEMALRGASDLGQLGQDIFESQALDPYRVVRKAIQDEGFTSAMGKVAAKAPQLLAPGVDRTTALLQVFPAQAAEVIRQSQQRTDQQSKDREALQKGERSLMGEAASAIASELTGDTTLAEEIGKAVAPPQDLAQTVELGSNFADPAFLESRLVKMGTRVGNVVAPALTKQLSTPILDVGGKAAKVTAAQEAKDRLAGIADNNRQAWAEAVQRSDVTAPPMQMPPRQLVPTSEAKSLFERRAAEAGKQTPGMVQKGVGAAGQAAETGGKFVERAAGKIDEVTDKYEGPLSLASTVAGASGGATGALLGSQLPGAVRKITKWSQNASRAGTALRTIANTDWGSSIPVWRQIANDPDAPQWLVRGVTANVAGKLKAGELVESKLKAGELVEKGLRVGTDLGKGILEGAATDAALTGMDTSKSGEEIGGEAGTGGLFGALGTLPALKSMSNERKALAFSYDSMRKASESIAAGADPMVIAATPDATMHSSVILEGMFRGMLPGRKDLKVDLMDGAQFAQASSDPGAAAYFDESTGRIAVNLESIDADGRQLHEVGHALMTSVAGSNPAIVQHFQQLLGADGLARARQDYQQALGRTVPQDDAFIVGELFSEALANGLRGANLNEALPTVLGRTQTQSFFRDADVRKAIKDPNTLELVRQQFQAASEFRPAVDMEKEPGVKLRPAQAGNHPALPTETRADGTQGNDFVDVTNGQARETPVPVVRARVRSRRREVLGLFPDVPPSGNVNPQASNVGVRQGPSGMTEKTGTRLGEQFYATARSFGDGTKNMLRRVEQAIAKNETLAGWYQQIGEGDGWSASVRESLGAMEAQYKDFMPFAFKVDKQGNLLVQNYSLSALERKAAGWAGRQGPLSLEMWNGDIGSFRQDVQTYLKNHAEGRPGSDGLGDMKRNLINVFLVGGNRTFEALNPLRAQAKGRDRQGIVRSYRADRLQTVEPSDVTGFEKPDYSKQVRNLSPEVVKLNKKTAIQINSYRHAEQLFDRGYTLYGASNDGFDDSPNLIRTLDELDKYDPENMVAMVPKGGDPVRNSPNVQLDTPEFKKWFAGSAVVNREGGPLMVYHGTSKDRPFSSFTRNAQGTWFTSDPESASSYAITNDSQRTVYENGRWVSKNTSSQIMPVFLSIKNPLMVEGDALQKWRNSVNYRAENRALVSQAKAAGHDGLAFPGGVYVAFEPTQIKSAIGNEGTFDPSNPDIRKSPTVSPEQLEIDFNKAVDQLGTEEALSPEEPSPAPRAPSRPKDAPTTFSITASRIKRLLKRGPVNPIGMSAATPQDRHAVAALFRNPAFEAMRWVFLKEGKVVAVANTTVRRPEMVYIMTKNVDEQQMAKLAAESGADSVFWTHNHPSGNSRPSDPDINATKRFWGPTLQSSPLSKLKFLGHIVTNHTDHHLIDVEGRINLINVGGFHDPMLKKPVWNDRIDSPSALARAGAALANGSNPARLILFLDPRLNVKAVGEISPNLDALKFAQEVRKYAKATGAISAVAYGSLGSDAPMMEQLVRDGILVDAHIIGIGGVRNAMMAPPSLLPIPDLVAAEDQIIRKADEKLLFSPPVDSNLPTSTDTGKRVDAPSNLAYSTPSEGEKIYGQKEQGAGRGDQSESGNRGGRYPGGSLTPLAGAPTVSGGGPNPELVAVAEQYAAANNIKLRRQAEYVQVDEDRARRIAQAYDEMPHAPQDPAVQEAYQDLIRQTLGQYKSLQDAGYEFTFFDSKSDPYKGNPWNAMRDLRANKRMAVYGTYAGYGTEGITQGAVKDNPMLAETGLQWPDQQGVMHPVTANDLFRAVHDAFGHGLEGSGFRAQGEENAWQAHIRLFTGPARGAITSETRGQNSWLNYGPYSERNRTAKTEDTVFAEQKTGLMPEWTWSEGRAADEAASEDIRLSPKVTPEQDAAYLAAAQKGDMKIAQRMVDEAAKAAGLGESRLNNGGNPEEMYHGSGWSAHNVFERGKSPSGRSKPYPGYGLDDIGFWFTSSKTQATEYGSVLQQEGGKRPPARLYNVFLNIKNPLEFADQQEFNEWIDSYARIHAVDEKSKTLMKGGRRLVGAVNVNMLLERLKMGKKDGIIIWKGDGDRRFGLKPNESYPTWAIAFDSNQIKSADPITRDDDGNVIPLSQRFTTSEDIRLSPAVTPDPQYLTRVPGAAVKAEKLELPAIDKKIKKLTDSLAKAATPSEKRAIQSEVKVLKASKKDVVPKISYTVPEQSKSLQKNALTGAKSMAKQVAMQAEYFGRLNTAVDQVKQDPARFVDPKGYVEFMKTVGVHGNVLMPPPGVSVLLKNPQQYVAYINGEYHGAKTKPGTIKAAMSGLDSTVAMRQAIQNRAPSAEGFSAPPPMVTALHHFWGILSRQLPPIHQEAAWLRLVSQPNVLEHIQKSIDGTLGPDFTEDKWDAIVEAGFNATAQPGNLLGNQGKSNANAFYLMLTKWNGMWDKVSDVYATPSSQEMGRKFWTLNRGAIGIKNKVQRFIGLTFGIPGLIMDRWKFVEFFMGQFGKAPQDYFKYTSSGTPEDVAGIYGGYGPIENGDPNFSLAFYEGMETVLQAAIDNSPELKGLLGKHPNVGGLHWVGWNAIKNEAVGHSSLDLTFDLLKNPNITPGSVLEQVRAREYYTEGLDGNTLKRFTLKP